MRSTLTSKVGVLAAVALGALMPGQALARGHDQVFGGCQLQGVTTVTNQATGAFHFAGSGTCIGELDGKPVVGAPLRITYRGTAAVLGGLVPLTGSGSGAARIKDPARGRTYVFPFTAQQVGTVLIATCRGGGNAVAALVPTEPPTPNPRTVKLAGALATLTPCRN